tara:strand:- start:1485 stop:1790 length:306 start_codon:yes stop_codon:yes gene_type:complete
MRNRIKYIKSLRNNNKKRYFKPLIYPNIPPTSNDIHIITTVGDRLDSLANQFYDDVRLWWIISTANPHIVRRDSYALKANLELRIPSNIQPILKSFERLNR